MRAVFRDRLGAPMRRFQRQPAARIVRWALGWIVVGVCGAGSGTTGLAQAPDSARYAPFAAELRRIQSTLGIPGMSVAVVDHGRVWTTSVGFADVERGIRVTPDTRFPIASLTKTMTAVTLMQLVDEGKLDVTAPAGLTGAAAAASPGALVRHVLSHTSDVGPGEEYVYNGGRFNALVPIIERAAGRSFAQAVQERILDPAGMRSTVASAAPADSIIATLARPYDFDSTSASRFRPGSVASIVIRGASGVASTARDLARYLVALDDGTLLSAARTTEMTTPWRSTTGLTLPYAYGWFVQDYLGETIRWHYGQEDSFGSLLLWIPGRHLGLVVLANSNAMSDAGRLLDGNVARSVVAQAFFSTVAPRAPTRELARDARIAEALAAVYTGHLARADSLTYAAFASAPELADRGDVTLLYLLGRVNDRRLDRPGRRMAEVLLREHPHLPPALYLASVVVTQAGDSSRALAILTQLGAIPSLPRHWSSIFGLMALADRQAAFDRAAARATYQRVIDMNLNFGGAVERAKAALATLKP